MKEQPKYVQGYKSYRSLEEMYKVTPIQDIDSFRRSQNTQSLAYQHRIDNRDNRLVSFESEIGHKLDGPQLMQRSIMGKIAWAIEERDQIIKERKEAAAKPIEPYVPYEEPPKPLKQRFKDWIIKFWSDANF